MAKSVFISNVLPAEARSLIPREWTVDYNETDIPLSKAELIRRLRGKEALVCHIISAIDEEVFAACPDLTVVANVAVGFNHVDEAALKRMKKTAVLVNAARGPIVDEAALVRALREGWIAGAGLDVFEDEPTIHPGLLPLPNVVLAPHIASASRDTRTGMAILAVRNCVAVLEGKPAITPVR